MQTPQRECFQTVLPNPPKPPICNFSCRCGVSRAAKRTTVRRSYVCEEGSCHTQRNQRFGSKFGRLLVGAGRTFSPKW